MEVLSAGDKGDAVEEKALTPALSGLTGEGECSAPALVVVVNDADAVYPVRIDPTFSDANWSSMNPGVPGTDGSVEAAVVDDSGNLYIGGSFSIAGNAPANNIAKWNGSSWAALGSGMRGGPNNQTVVSALAVSGGDLYAGGGFTVAGGSAANYIAKWNGSSWSSLGSGLDGGFNSLSGINPGVFALAVSGSDLYAAGIFTVASGKASPYLARAYLPVFPALSLLRSSANVIVSWLRLTRPVSRWNRPAR
jgi:hypothetical protein